MTSPRLEQASPSHSPYRELVHYKQVHREARQQGPLKACCCLSLALFLYADIYYLYLLNNLFNLPAFMDYVKGIVCGTMIMLCVGHVASFALAYLSPDREIENSRARLLNISNDDLGFKVAPDHLTTPICTPSIEKLPLGSFCLPSAQNSFSESFNNSLTSSSWQFQSASRPYRLETSFDRLKSCGRYPNARALDWHIEDEHSADAYLLERSREQQSLVGTIAEDTEFGSQASRHNRSSLIDVGVEAIQRLFQSQPYKAASPTHPEGDKGTEASSAAICKKWNIDQKALFSWNRNLRFWFHRELFRPLCQSIQHVNDNISKLGFGRDYMIGVAGVAQLRHLAALRNEQLPALENIIPFLTITGNQEYLIDRYREFANGGALSKMKWSRGGTTWNEQLPADAEILMFAFATYIDSSLPPDPAYQDGRQFTKNHTKESFEENLPTNGGSVAIIHHRSRNPPHYQLQLGNELIDVGPGPANVLHTIILFLYHHKIRNDERICHMPMGPTGLNVLGIFS